MKYENFEKIKLIVEHNIDWLLFIGIDILFVALLVVSFYAYQNRRRKSIAEFTKRRGLPDFNSPPPPPPPIDETEAMKTAVFRLRTALIVAEKDFQENFFVLNFIKPEHFDRFEYLIKNKYTIHQAYCALPTKLFDSETE